MGYVILALVIAITIYSLYLSKKDKIVVFDNFTDLFFTVFTVILSIAAFLYCTSHASITTIIVYQIPAIICFGIICWKTYIYNQSIHAGIAGTLLGIFTKMAVVGGLGIILVLTIAYFFIGGERRKYQRTSSYNREHAAKTAGIGSLMGLLAFLGTRNENFIPIKEYFDLK